MILIGEKLNSSIPKTGDALRGGDDAYLISLVRAQAEAGAKYLDLNAAVCDDEEKGLRKLVSLALMHSDCGLALDSSDPEVIAAVLPHTGGRRLIFNSITLTERAERLIPLADEHSAGVIALPIDGAGVPHSAKERFDNAVTLVERLREGGIVDDNIFIDVLVEALAVSDGGARVTLDTIRLIAAEFPEVHRVCGLSNISFGLPSRADINTAFMSMAICCGLDALLYDVCSSRMRTALLASEALCGHDEYCMEYISDARSRMAGN